MAFDMQVEGTEEQKNRFLAPAPKVPQIDRKSQKSRKNSWFGRLARPDKKTDNPRHG